MASVAQSTIVELLDKAPFRILQGSKQLTLVLGGLYIASTTATSKPYLVWESEKSYPRYYIPSDSLHEKIRPLLSKADQPSSDRLVKLRELSTTTGKDAKAVTEELTVGGKTTTWIRFLSGHFAGLIRFERNEIDDWFENGALFAGIKNPYKRIDTTPVARHIVVKVDGHVVAETQVAVSLFETGVGETLYLPATSIKDWGAVTKSDLRTACPYKGEAWYLSLEVGGKKYDNLIWYYQYPTHESAGIEGFISFYRKDFVEVIVDGTPL